MTHHTQAVCVACNGTYPLSQEQLGQLEKAEPISCTGCGLAVNLKPDPAAERSAMFSVLTLTIGAIIVGGTALINIFGSAGFPTYYVAIPYLLISLMLTAGQKSRVLELQRADAPDQLERVGSESLARPADSVRDFSEPDHQI